MVLFVVETHLSVPECQLPADLNAWGEMGRETNGTDMPPRR
jgi:hypothetical protein